MSAARGSMPATARSRAWDLEEGVAVEQVGRLADVTAVERAYLRLVAARGVDAPAAKRIQLADPVADDGESDCWTHAWEYAQQSGATYVEGVCIRPGAGSVSMHAWVEEHTVFGPQVVELTPGYEHASSYRGLRVDCRAGGPLDRTLTWDGPRGSMIQGLLDSGFSVAQALERIRPS